MSRVLIRQFVISVRPPPPPPITNKNKNKQTTPPPKTELLKERLISTNTKQNQQLPLASIH